MTSEERRREKIKEWRTDWRVEEMRGKEKREKSRDRIIR